MNILLITLGAVGLTDLLGILTVYLLLLPAAALTAKQRCTAARDWPRLLARTRHHRRRYVHQARKSASTAALINQFAKTPLLDLADEDAADAKELFDVHTIVARLPKFRVFLRDTASAASFDEPTEPELTRIRVALTRADEIRRTYRL